MCLRDYRLSNLGRPLFKKCRFRTPLGSQHVKGSQTLVKSAWEHLYHIFWSLWGETTWKLSPLLNLEIWGVFVNTLTADENYPFGDSGDLQFSIQMQLPYKRKTFSEFLVPFMRSPSTFKHFLKTDDRDC